jgi:hypothetical protein
VFLPPLPTPLEYHSVPLRSTPLRLQLAPSSNTGSSNALIVPYIQDTSETVLQRKCICTEGVLEEEVHYIGDNRSVIKIRIRALQFLRANLDNPTSLAGFASPVGPVGHTVT